MSAFPYNDLDGKQFRAFVLFEHLKYLEYTKRYDWLSRLHSREQDSNLLLWIMNLKYTLRIFHNKNLLYCTNVLTLYNVCAVPWRVFSTVGGVQYRGGIS